MKAGSGMKILVFLTEWSKEYLYDFYQGLEKYVREYSDVQIDIYACFSKAELEKVSRQIEYDFLDLPDLSLYDGIILPMVTFMDNDYRQKLVERIRQSGVPCVTVEEEVKGFSSIGIDQYRAMRSMVEHMIQKHGAKHLGYVGGIEQSYESATREQAFRDTLFRYGIEIDKNWFFHRRYQYGDGVEIGQRLLTAYRLRQEIPDTMICANDEMMIGICDIIYGTELWGKVRLTGFDYFSHAEGYSPMVTSVARPRWEMSYESCRLLVEFLQTKPKQPVCRKLSHRLVFGETCGCLDRGHWKQGESEYRRNTFTEDLRRQNMQERMELMEERTTQNISEEELLGEICEVLSEFGCRRCRIILSDQLISGEKVEYRDCKRLAVDWYQILDLDDSKMTDRLVMYVPLHFQERVMGYCYLEGVDQLLEYGLIGSFFRKTSFSLENYIQKQQYSEINKKYQQLYMSDQLTGLYNRFGLQEYGQRLYEANCKKCQDTEIIFCDINGLKYINDTFGHKAGDFAIQTMGEALKGQTSEECLPFRYGGDEFIVIANANSGTDRIAQIRAKLREIQEHVTMDFEVNASIGRIIAPWKEHKDLDYYFIRADELMYQEKMKFHKKTK